MLHIKKLSLLLVVTLSITLTSGGPVDAEHPADAAHDHVKAPTAPAHNAYPEDEEGQHSPPGISKDTEAGEDDKDGDGTEEGKEHGDVGHGKGHGDGHEEDERKDKHDHHHHWEYHGELGPDNWAAVDRRCAHHSPRQSPINVLIHHSEYSDSLDRISLKDSGDADGSITGLNNGHSVNFRFANSIRVKGGDLTATYKVAGAHFHWGRTDAVGSEHYINGHSFPLELHIVTYNEDDYDNVGAAVNGVDSLAVLGVLFQISDEDNPAMEPIVAALSEAKDQGVPVNVEKFELDDLLPINTKEYYRYEGSLTTPPCAESVIWTVFRHPISISSAQLAQFRLLNKTPAHPAHHVARIDQNWRPVQHIHARTVYRSFHLHADSTKLHHETKVIYLQADKRTHDLMESFVEEGDDVRGASDNVKQRVKEENDDVQPRLEYPKAVEAQSAGVPCLPSAYQLIIISVVGLLKHVCFS